MVKMYGFWAQSFVSGLGPLANLNLAAHPFPANITNIAMFAAAGQKSEHPTWFLVVRPQPGSLVSTLRTMASILLVWARTPLILPSTNICDLAPAKRGL